MTLVRHVRRSMGTAIAISVPSEAADLVEPAFRWLDWVDRTFSVHSPQSVVSQIGAGRLQVGDADPLVQSVLAICVEMEEMTDGWFLPRSPDRPLDPSGFVKGWAVDRVIDDIAAAGVENASVSAGGDVAVLGVDPETGEPWRIGITHPDGSGVIAIVGLADACIATSGAYERGDHIWGATGGVRSATVVGPSLGTADALATAIYADGGSDLGWTDRFPLYDTLVFGDGVIGSSPGMDRRLLSTI